MNQSDKKETTRGGHLGEFCKAKQDHRTGSSLIERKRHATRSATEKLRCPVCLEYPRGPPIFSCKNKHLLCGHCQRQVALIHHCDTERFCLCGGCHELLTTSPICEVRKRACKGRCPLCRDHNLKQDEFLEDLVGDILINKRENCRFKDYTCGVNDRLENLAIHEEECRYRIAQCPSTHRGTCDWFGSLSHLASHDAHHDCLHTLHSVPSTNQFESYIRDFDEVEDSIFYGNRISHWKPTLLVSDQLASRKVFLTVHRDPPGVWYIILRALSPKSLLEQVRAKIELFKDGSDESEKLSLEGEINTNIPSAEVVEGGRLFILSDNQLRHLHSDSSLFHYRVTLRVAEKGTTSTDADDSRSLALSQRNGH